MAWIPSKDVSYLTQGMLMVGMGMDKERQGKHARGGGGVVTGAAAAHARWRQCNWPPRNSLALALCSHMQMQFILDTVSQRLPEKIDRLAIVLLLVALERPCEPLHQAHKLDRLPLQLHGVLCPCQHHECLSQQLVVVLPSAGHRRNVLVAADDFARRAHEAAVLLDAPLNLGGRCAFLAPACRNKKTLANVCQCLECVIV